MVAKKVSIEDVKNSIDPETAKKLIVEFLRKYIEESGAKCCVIGLSGGVDSTTTAYLTVEAVGSNKVIGLIMPDTRVTPKEDVEDAVQVAKSLGIDYRVIEIDKLVDYATSTANVKSRIAVGNVRARVRAVLLYAVANESSGLVVGTSDKSELILGYFTKYGDGAVDILPIGDLYKTQVRILAKHLGVPDKIAFKPSSPRLWPGHTAEEELGVPYEVIDVVLYARYELGIPENEIPQVTGVDKKVVDRIFEMVKANRHKRAPPPIPKVSRGPLAFEV